MRYAGEFAEILCHVMRSAVASFRSPDRYALQAYYIGIYYVYIGAAAAGICILY